MKYKPSLYAKAFTAALEEHPGKEKDLFVNLRTLLIRTGDISHANRVVEAIEGELVRRHGGHIVVVETARPLGDTLQKRIRDSFLREDQIKEFVRPELGAGMRIIKDNEKEFNASLQYKLKQLLNI
jgi:F0F1-type ATP synthase delta subunit